MARLSWGPRELVFTLFKFALSPLRCNYMIVIHFSRAQKQAAKMEKWPHWVHTLSIVFLLI